MSRKRFDNVSGEYISQPLPRVNVQTYIDVRIFAAAVEKFCKNEGILATDKSLCVRKILTAYADTPIETVGEALVTLSSFGIDLTKQLQGRLGKDIIRFVQSENAPKVETPQSVASRAAEIAGMEDGDDS